MNAHVCLLLSIFINECFVFSVLYTADCPEGCDHCFNEDEIILCLQCSTGFALTNFPNHPYSNCGRVVDCPPGLCHTCYHWEGADYCSLCEDGYAVGLTGACEGSSACQIIYFSLKTKI